MRSYALKPIIITGCLAVGFFRAVPILAQDAEPVALISLVGGEGAARTESDELVTMEGLLVNPQPLSPGQGIRTFANGTATILLEAYDTAIFMESSSELRFTAPTTPDSGIDFVIEVVEGKVSIIQKPDNEKWLATAALARPKGAYILSRGASLIVDLNEDGASIVCAQGELAYYSGRLPGAKLINTDGELLKTAKTSIQSNERFSVGVDNARPVTAEVAIASTSVEEDIHQFALTESGSWLARAEQGDFTPVRGAGRGAPEPLSAQLNTDLAFDQPRPVLTTPSPPTVTPSVGSLLNPSQALVESGSPGTVVAGQRFRRSRILGNPGTTGVGRLTVNGAAEQLISLRRN